MTCVQSLLPSPIAISSLPPLPSQITTLYRCCFPPPSLCSEHDFVMAESRSLVSTLSLLFASLLSKAQFAFTKHLFTEHVSFQPTIIAADAASVTAFCTELRAHQPRSLTRFFPFSVCRSRRRNAYVEAHVGPKLRLCLVFYTTRPLCKPDYFLL